MARLGVRSPATLIRLAWKHRGSLAGFKTAIAEKVLIDPKTLPYEPRVLTCLREASASGRRLILATASPAAWAEPIAAELDLFSDVIATNGSENFKKTRKLAAIRNLLGDEPFAYMGDSNDDIPLFEAAEGGCLLAGSAAGPLAFFEKSATSYQHVAPTDKGTKLRAIVRACRPAHWIKNLLIFVPAVTGWGMYEPHMLVYAVFAFAAFCSAASAVYLINDLSDLAADRAHPEKRHRPLAAGLVPVSTAVILALCLITLAIGFAVFAGPLAVGAIFLYLILNAAYSIRLKEIALADIALLCGFYLLRVMLGLMVLGLPQSIWFLAFLGCLFAELALWKRYVEARSTPASKSKRRSYTPEDAMVLLAFGVGFSFTAAVVLTLYLRSTEISPVYRSPESLALLAPILLLHNLGMWLGASRGHGASDPVTYILRSRKFWIGAVGAALVLLAARLLPLS
jgi:4-hydroxybenzoate polyprenyltransferase